MFLRRWRPLLTGLFWLCARRPQAFSGGLARHCCNGPFPGALNVALRVPALQPLHPGHQIAFGRLSQKMAMVVHEHAGMTAPAVLTARFPKRLYKPLPILVLLEDGATLIAPRHEMIPGSRIFDAQKSGHATIVPQLQIKRQL